MDLLKIRFSGHAPNTLFDDLLVLAKIFIYFVLIILFFQGAYMAHGGDNGDARRSRPQTPEEYRIKAAFLFNFIKFIDWPPEVLIDKNQPFSVCVLGENPFGDFISDLEAQSTHGKKLRIEFLQSYERPNDIRQFHILFISASMEEQTAAILNDLDGYPALTVGDHATFALNGGIINFLIHNKKVRFEINLAAAKRTRLKISSKLLRLAQNIFEN